MHPTESHDASPRGLLRMCVRQRGLLRHMMIREVAQRYRGSWLGLAWSFVTPLLMLGVYTVVFSVVFEARWAGKTGGEMPPQTGEFALILFCGLLLHAYFADCLTRSPHCILSNVNFVKKVIFPLEILPVVVVGSALFHLAMGLAVLLAGQAIVGGGLPATAPLALLVLAPFVMLSLGMAWMLASIGVYVRDIGQVLGLVVTVLLFLSPVFYPPEALPEAWRPYLALNPLTLIIENLRAVLLWGHMPDWAALGLYSAVSGLWMLLGFAWFQKTRKGFADVV